MAVLKVTVVIEAIDAISQIRKLAQAFSLLRKVINNTRGTMKGVNRQLRDLLNVTNQAERGANRYGRALRGLQRVLRDFGRTARLAFTQLQNAMFRAFTGQGALFGLALRLFAPIGGISRGLQSLGLAARGLIGIFSGGPFQAVPNLFRAIGNAIAGAGGILGGFVAQIGLISGMITRVTSIILAAVSKILSVGLKMAAPLIAIVNPILGGIALIAGSLLSVASEVIPAIGSLIASLQEAILGIFGEILRAAGQMFGGIANLAAEMVQPVVNAFQFMVSPITQVFRLIAFAWQNSLVIMGIGTGIFLKKSISEFLDFQKQISTAVLQLPLSNQGDFDRSSAAVKNASIGLSNELGIDAAVIAKQFQRALSVGFDIGTTGPRSADEIVKQAGLLTIAGGDPDKSIIALTQLMNSFGNETLDATELADKFFAAFRVGGGDISFFARGLGTAGAAAAAFGATLEETLFITAAMSRAAQENQRIFTGFQRLVERLAITPGLTGSISERLNQVKKAIVSDSGELNIPLLVEIFPRIQSRRAFAQFIKTFDIEGVEEQIRNAPRGSLEKSVGFLDKTAQRAVEFMTQALANFRKKLGELASPTILRGVEFLKDLFIDMQFAVDVLGATGGLEKLARSVEVLLRALGIPQALDNLPDFFLNMIENTLPAFVNMLTSTVNAVKRLFSQLMKILGLDDVTINLKESFDALSKILDEIDFKIVLDRAIIFAASMADALTDAFKSVVTTITPIFDFLFNFLMNQMIRIINTARSVARFIPGGTALLKSAGLAADISPKDIRLFNLKTAGLSTRGADFEQIRQIKLRIAEEVERNPLQDPREVAERLVNSFEFMHGGLRAPKQEQLEGAAKAFIAMRDQFDPVLVNLKSFQEGVNNSKVALEEWTKRLKGPGNFIRSRVQTTRGRLSVNARQQGLLSEEGAAGVSVLNFAGLVLGLTPGTTGRLIGTATGGDPAVIDSFVNGMLDLMESVKKIENDKTRQSENSLNP